MGGLTPCPDIVDEVLDPAKHPNAHFPASILDLGCGSGIWALEMVRMLTTTLILRSNGFVNLRLKSTLGRQWLA
jgi:methylase of polypeptide subunit release factors